MSPNVREWTIDREELTVVYSAKDAHLAAYIRLERDDALLKEESFEQGAEDDIDWMELKTANVKSRAVFTKLLNDNARATESLSLWCYRPVWLKLLQLLDVRQPLPDEVGWPPKGDSHGG